MGFLDKINYSMITAARSPQQNIGLWNQHVL